jgi:hypothetical protein
VRVLVAVLTYRRAHLLGPLLAEIVAQKEDVSPGGEVVVIDNDPAASASDAVSNWASHGVRYVHEPHPGISAARNRALAEAADADLLVFIDDDELPSAGWLAELTSAWRRWGCAAVAGPVPARMLAPASEWVLGSGAFDRRTMPTGTLVQGAGAGNLLLDVRQVRALGLTFDERLGLTGGEDTQFTHELVHRGGEIRWCDEAVAVESVPAERLTRTWVLRRSFRSASSLSRTEVRLAGGALPRWRTRVIVLAKAAVRITLACCGALAAIVRRDVARRARAVATIAAYSGLVVGAFGFGLAEYARSPVAGPSTGPTAGTPSGELHGAR